jgi:hypothetical protein
LVHSKINKNNMRKIYLFTIILLTACLAACTEDFNEGVVPPQSYPQEPAITMAIQAENAATVYNMADIQTEDVAIAKIASLSGVEDASVVYKVLISQTVGDFADKVVYAASADGNTINLATADLRAAVENFYGKRPVARNLSIVIDAYVTSLDKTFYLRSNELKIAVTLTAPVIESAYYLIGDVNGWIFDNLDTYQFSHSGKDVYDDPIFTIKVYMSAGYFKIVPQSSKDAGSWDGVIGNPVDGNTALEGTLIIDNSQAMRVTEDGWVQITLNMMDYTYTIELLGNAKTELYVPGGHQGWKPETAPIVYSPNLDWKFDGYVYMEGGNEFKFTSTPDPNWSGTNYGDGGDGTLSTDGGAGNLSVSENGFYRLTVDLSKDPYTYTVTATTWGLIGDATPGGWDASTPMTLNSATGEWSVTTTLSGGKDFKFRANDGWDINLGGEATNLTYGGGNIPVAEDGTYGITLKLGDASAYTYTIVKQ